MKMNKKKVIILSSVLIISICVILLYFFTTKDSQIKKELQLTFLQDSKEVEYGSEVDSKTFIKDGQAYVKTYPTIDTKKLGKQKIVYVLEKEEVEKEITYTIEVVDTKEPIIKFTMDKVEIERNSSFHLEDYLKEVSDVVDGNLTLYTEGEQKGTYKIEDNVDVSTVGEYEIKIIATDKNGNEATSILNVSVKDNVATPIVPDPTQVKPTYIKGILLVNKEYGIPASFGGENESANTALYQLQQGASSAGYDMPLLSGYRSYEYQVGLYNSYVQRDGQEAADRYSARPGYSEHQTGLCFDIGAIDNNYGETDAGKWLAQHAHEYGFIIRFPQGMEHITGYMYEPWHVRFVGTQVANEIFAQGVTLEEYLNVY